MIQTEALQIIQTVAHFGSFATAARHLHKVPSAISYTVRKVEEQLDVQLFFRDSRKVKLTPAGEHFVAGADKVLNQLHKLADSTCQVATGVESELHIVVDNIVNQGGIHSLVAAFKEKFPDVTLYITPEVYIGCWDALYHDRCQLAIGAPITIPEEIECNNQFEWRTMGHLDWHLVMSPDHPLAEDLETPLSTNDLADYTTIVVLDTSRVLHHGGDSLANYGRKMIVPDFRQALACAKQGIGVTMAPAHFTNHFMKDGRLVTRPIPLTYNRECLIAWNREHIGAGLQWCLDWLGNEKTLTDLWLTYREGKAAVDIS